MERYNVTVGGGRRHCSSEGWAGLGEFLVNFTIFGKQTFYPQVSC